MTYAFYDPILTECKSVTGAVDDKTDLTVTVFTDASSATIKFFPDDGEFIALSGKCDGNGMAVFDIPRLPVGLYFYLFELDGVTVGRNLFDKAEKDSADKFQLSVYSSSYVFSSLISGGVIYQIFPDRFAKADGFGDATGRKTKKWGEEPEYEPDERGEILNDDFFCGNFEGIRRKIAYLKSLGVTAIYLNPLCLSPSNHRYDTSDYFRLDPVLGDEKDISHLIKDCKNVNISLIFDGVYNHVGADSVYFDKYGNFSGKGAFRDKNSPYVNWFSFTDYPNVYESWWGINTLPKIKRGTEDFERLVAGEGGALDFFMSLGFDGVRLDVVDELSDDFIEKINRRIKSYGEEKIVVGEVWEDATNKISYGERKKYFLGGELDSVMNYPLKDAILSYVMNGEADRLVGVMREQIDHYPERALNCLMNVLGTHDTPRVLTVLGKSGNIAASRDAMAKERLTPEEYSLGISRLKCASLLQYTVYGVPCIYYGDETGAEGNKDPFNRRCFIENSADKDLLEWYTFLGKVRMFDCFDGGRAESIFSDGGVIAYSRRGMSCSVTVVINCSGNVFDVTCESESYELSRRIKTSKISLNKYDFAILYFGGEDDLSRF